MSDRASQFASLLRETRLYAVTDDALPTAELLRVVDALLDAGVRLFQYRDKRASDAQRTETARALTAMVHAHGGLLVVNDRVDVAVAAGADGAHLGQADLPLAQGRAILGPDLLLGASASYLHELPEAERDGADHLGFGAIFPTGTKMDAEYAGLDLLEQACRLATVPVIGIGGITPERAAAVIQRGADGVAVVSALFRAPDPRRAAREFLVRLEGATRS